MSAEDLENYEADRELALAQEYRDVSPMFRFAVETERRFYLANIVNVNVLDEQRPMVEVRLTDVWVWDMYRQNRFVKSVQVITFKDVNIEELAKADEGFAAEVT